MLHRNAFTCLSYNSDPYTKTAQTEEGLKSMQRKVYGHHYELSLYFLNPYFFFNSKCSFCFKCNIEKHSYSNYPLHKFIRLTLICILWISLHFEHPLASNDVSHLYDCRYHGWIQISIYDNWNDFNSEIWNFPRLSSNISNSHAYEVYISKLFRYSRACSCLSDFIYTFLAPES